jgi:hypothetical protein
MLANFSISARSTDPCMALRRAAAGPTGDLWNDSIQIRQMIENAA